MNIQFEAMADLEDSQALNVFSPIRIDWLTGKDDYLRR